jgi:nucleoside-diphosphate-sugar epimerase
MKKIILTGAGGFVGRYFLEHYRDKYEIKTLNLRDDAWKKENLAGYDAVVHLAGKAHEMQAIDERIYYDVNLNLTRQLFEKAAAEGVTQFIFISTTKVYGDRITGVLSEQSPYGAEDAYGKSKQQAEEYLLEQKSGSVTVSIVRPPLVYGPGVKGNMISLLKLCAKKWPLPFGNTGNRRSMVYVGNLAALISTVIEKRAAGVFVAGDAAPMSTHELVAHIRKAMGRKPGLVTIPGFMRSLIKKIRPAMHTRLFGSFEVNNSQTRQFLSFTAPYSTEEGVGQMVKWYLSES